MQSISLAFFNTTTVHLYYFVIRALLAPSLARLCILLHGKNVYTSSCYV